MDTTASNMQTGTHAQLEILGMTCAGCARRVEGSLTATPGVEDASVNFATRTAHVRYDPTRTSVSALVDAISGTGYQVVAPAKPSAQEAEGDAEEGPDVAEQRDLRRRLSVAVGFGLPVLILGMSHGTLGGASSPWVQLALSLPVLTYGGAPIFRAAWAALRHRAADMNSLVALGSGAAFLYSAVVTARQGAHHDSQAGHGPAVYFEAAVAVLGFVLLGRLLESRARVHAGEALRRLRGLAPPRAVVIRKGREAELSIDQVQVGDRVVLRPGQLVAVDGTVEEGESAVDESMLTGESVPVPKEPGALVFAGTLNTAGRLLYRASRVGRDTALAQIAAAVERAQGTKAPIARLADRVSGVFTPIVLLLSLLTFAAWFLLSPVETRLAEALIHAVAVLVIACPCALGLATPAALVVGTGRGAALGVLFHDAAALERASRIDAVVFDKTGTLTEGRAHLDVVIPTARVTEAELLAVAAAVETGSEHPLGKAVVSAASERGLRVPRATSFHATPGRGIAAQIDGQTVLVGSAAYLAANHVESGDSLTQSLAERGLTPVLVAREGVLLGALGLADTIRPEAASALMALRNLHIEPVMLTGDQPAPAHRVAAALGIQRVIAEATPEAKAQLVRSLRASGRRVAMVGDGVNDAPALAEADLGVAMGTGADVAQAAAGVTLLRADLRLLPTSLRLARATLRVIRQNLFWAFAYNVLGIPLAAGVFASLLGGSLSPMVASLAMSLSSVSVLLSSLRLKNMAL